MNMYYVSVQETLKKTVGVLADNEEQAIEKVKDAYCESNIVLDADDYVEDSTKIELEPDQEGCREIDGLDDLEEDDLYYQHID